MTPALSSLRGGGGGPPCQNPPRCESGPGACSSMSCASRARPVKSLWEKGVSDGREREPFPLPCLSSTLDGAKPSSSKSCRRLGRRLHANTTVNSLARGLNQLAAGGVSKSGEVDAPPTMLVQNLSEVPRDAQRDVLRRLIGVAKAQPTCPSDLDSKRALGELLKESSGSYATVARGAVAPYRSGAVSLPRQAHAELELEALLPPEWRGKLTPESLLLPLEEGEANRANWDGDAYFDEVLKGDEMLYVEFVADLAAAGMLRFDVDVKESTAPFFVWKDEEGNLRNLFDLRPSNTRFRKPPKVRLLTPEGMSRMEVESGEHLYSSGYDLKDYYHYIRVPKWLSEYFGLPKLKSELLAKLLAKKGLEELARQVRIHARNGLIEPALATLPMGWTWSVFFAQLVHEHILAASVPDLSYLHDQKVIGEISGKSERPNHVFAYLDDGGVFGREEGPVNKDHARVLDAVRQAGFVDHAKKGYEATTSWEKLGVMVESLDRTRLMVKTRRQWRLSLGIAELLRRPCVRPEEVEQVVGHFTQAFLLRRPLLAVFHHVYTWLRRAAAVSYTHLTLPTKRIV